ncbi:hypothetical protein HPT25_22150 [Bacillus sp. BRMEA1]|uniref:hypothetical protein n=1 Tax=Neobacillus endophyticus TaxID=2738405 RepID=UPI0015666B6D|nr:hypothetical protein [Neobacillus endophyticus]NRD80043.1 hypothetical protein [Neobacillus endophyticus]
MVDLNKWLNLLDNPIPIKCNVSIDRIALMGNFTYGSHLLFQKMVTSESLVEGNPLIVIENGITKYPKGKIFNDITFIFTNKEKFKNSRDVKFEFNPNKLSIEQITYFKDKILPLVKNVGFTRIDIAFDIETKLSDYMIIQNNKVRKIHLIIGNDGNIETYYIGSRESDYMVRIYDKVKEIKNRLNKGEKITTYEEKIIASNSPLWRIELELKGDSDSIKAYLDSPEDILQGIQFIKPDWKMVTKQKERSMVKLFIDAPEEFSNLKNTNSIKKYKDLLSSVSPYDLTDLLIQRYSICQDDLMENLKEYINSSIKMFYDEEFETPNDILNMSKQEYEKQQKEKEKLLKEYEEKKALYDTLDSIDSETIYNELFQIKMKHIKKRELIGFLELLGFSPSEIKDGNISMDEIERRKIEHLKRNKEYLIQLEKSKFAGIRKNNN